MTAILISRWPPSVAIWRPWRIKYISCLQAVRPVAQAETGDKNAEFTPLSLFAFFVNRCREHLHIIIAFSPIGDAFRNRLRQFPSLINCCTIDWFQVSNEPKRFRKYNISCSSFRFSDKKGKEIRLRFSNFI